MLRTHIKICIGAFREQIWLEDWSFGDMLPEYLLPDSSIENLAKAHETLLSLDDLLKVEGSYQWPLVSQYGERFFEAFKGARKEVEDKWAENQQRLDKKRAETEKAKAAQKRQAQDDRAGQKKQKKGEQSEAKRLAQQKKYEAYYGKLARGERVMGQPPKKPE
jgi:DNA segregation ATPase FtsK/SpoIIIE-like protein